MLARELAPEPSSGGQAPRGGGAHNSQVPRCRRALFGLHQLLRADVRLRKRVLRVVCPGPQQRPRRPGDAPARATPLAASCTRGAAPRCTSRVRGIGRARLPGRPGVGRAPHSGGGVGGNADVISTLRRITRCRVIANVKSCIQNVKSILEDFIRVRAELPKCEYG